MRGCPAAGDDAGLPDDAVTFELLSGEVDLEATGEPVPVMDFVLLVAAADVCDEQITAEQVLNDESCRSALAMCRIAGVPLREALGVETSRIRTPRPTECAFELEQRMGHGVSVARDLPNSNGSANWRWCDIERSQNAATKRSNPHIGRTRRSGLENGSRAVSI
jgi:hypothetical protein